MSPPKVASIFQRKTDFAFFLQLLSSGSIRRQLDLASGKEIMGPRRSSSPLPIACGGKGVGHPHDYVLKESEGILPQ